MNNSHSLQESTTDCCTYLGDAEETGIYSPQPLPLVNYAQDYAALLDKPDGGGNFITPSRQKRLSITAVSAPSKKSNKVSFRTPTGQDVDLADTPSSPPDDDDANYDNEIFTQQMTPSSRKRSAAAAGDTRATKRRKTAANNVILTPHAEKPPMLTFEDDEHDIPEIDDTINEDEELEKIIG